jgi:hypothetical protein
MKGIQFARASGPDPAQREQSKSLFGVKRTGSCDLDGPAQIDSRTKTRDDLKRLQLDCKR